MKLDRKSLTKLKHQFEALDYLADASKQFNVGKFKVYENRNEWVAEGAGLKKEFSTRMAALSWAKFISEGRNSCATTVEHLSEEFDGATAQLKQLVKTSIRHPAVLGKVDPAADKRIEKIDKLAEYILKNS